jgi:hypothetical protein
MAPGAPALGALVEIDHIHIGHADAAYESGVSLATIHRAESVDGKTAMTFANASAIRRALENAGVELIEENGGGPGARLKQHVSDQ